MTSFESAAFWALVGLTAVLCAGLPAAARRLRCGILTAAGLLFASLILGLSPLALAVIVLVTFWVAVGLRFLPGRRPMVVYIALLGPVAAAWILGKQAVALSWGDPLELLYFVGFSFYLVKVWTVVRDSQNGLVQPEPFTVAAYLLHVPTFALGPMHTYGEFSQATRNPRALRGAELLDIAFRVLVGLLKVRLLAPLLAPSSLLGVLQANEVTVQSLLLGSVVYSFVIYLDFSGYCDLAISASRLLGVPCPENFARPYLAPNIRDFWQRWHITFSRVLTSYVFVPLTRSLMRKWPRRPRTIMVLGYLVTFGFCGYWHGPTLNFLLWGLYHASGLIIFDYFRKWRPVRPAHLMRRVPPWWRTLLVRIGSTVLTFAFVSVGWILFVYPVHMLWR